MGKYSKEFWQIRDGIFSQQASLVQLMPPNKACSGRAGFVPLNWQFSNLGLFRLWTVFSPLPPSAANANRWAFAIFFVCAFFDLGFGSLAASPSKQETVFPVLRVLAHFPHLPKDYLYRATASKPVQYPSEITQGQSR